MGRVRFRKINPLLDDVAAFRQQTDSDIKIVLTGGIDQNIPHDRHPDILFTGFVSEAEKSALMEHATLMVNPSRVESLSLLLLEGMSQGVPLLVNGQCDVLKAHCTLSAGAACEYLSREMFIEQLQRLVSDDSLRHTMGEHGRHYVARMYAWPTIIAK